MRLLGEKRSAQRTVALLGPQRTPRVSEALGPLIGDAEPVAVVTAGWEERETELDEMSQHLERDVTNLALYARAEDVFQRDPELHTALQQHHARLRSLHQLYRLRLRYLVPAAEKLLARKGRRSLIEPEREAAIEDVRALDDHYLGRVAALQREIEDEWQPTTRDAVAEHRQELEALLAGCAALCIAGGHVRVLLTRLKLFDILGMLPTSTPIVAWSAGAMVLTDRVVLFHDSPPQGRGFAEVMRPGLGVCPGIVALPHASRRLQLDDPVRVQLFARRFRGARCVALDPGTQLVLEGGLWTAPEPTLQLTENGTLEAVAGGVN